MNCLKERVEKLSKFHQIEILKILKKDDNTTINENNNGIFINMTNLNSSIVEDIIAYLDYVSEQEKHLTYIENKKEVLSHTFFDDANNDMSSDVKDDVKDNKDIHSITLNA
jgi:hypothetical protein